MPALLADPLLYRLRRYANTFTSANKYDEAIALNDAADEIERLRAGQPPADSWSDLDRDERIALRAALGLLSGALAKPLEAAERARAHPDTTPPLVLRRCREMLDSITRQQQVIASLHARLDRLDRLPVPARSQGLQP